MIGANFIRGLLLLLLLAFRSPEMVWVVYVVAFFVSVANLFFGPANNALLPQLVKEEELVSANSLDAFGENVARIIGPAVGGAILAFAGLTSVALIDVGTYLVGAGLIFLIQPPVLSRVEDRVEAVERSVKSEWLDFWKDWIGGLRVVSRQRPLSYTFLAAGTALIGDNILGVLLVVFVQNVVGGESQEFGWILTARGVGGVIGGLIVARVGSRIQTKNLMAIGMLGIGVLLLVMLQFPTLPVVLTVAVLLGLPAMAWMIAGQTWMQAHTEDEYRGRVFGAFETYAALMGLIGIGFATLFGESLGELFSLYAAALLSIVGGSLAYVILQPRFISRGQTKKRVIS